MYSHHAIVYIMWKDRVQPSHAQFFVETVFKPFKMPTEN